LVTVLIVLTVLHVLGAIKHQFIMKDGLMSRMSLRKKD
jgi:cytochrome b561